MSKNLTNLLLLTASFALYYVVVGPLYQGGGGVFDFGQSIQSLRTLNSQYDGTLSQAETLITQAESLRDQYNKVTVEDKAKMSIMIPDDIDKVHLLSEVYKIGEDADFALKDLTFSDGLSTISGKGSVAVSFSVKTTYPRFKELMNNFEKSMRLFSVESVTFTAPTKADELTTYQVKLQTYYLK